MKLYTVMEGIDNIDSSLVSEKHSIMETAIKQYSKLKKIGKTHRSVLDKNQRDVHDIETSFPLRKISPANTTNRIDCMTNRINDHKNLNHIKEETIGLLVNKMNKM